VEFAISQHFYVDKVIHRGRIEVEHVEDIFADLEEFTLNLLPVSIDHRESSWVRVARESVVIYEIGQ
jgi:hypothetical protein